MAAKRRCEWCEEEFTSRKPSDPKRFCSKACMYDWRRGKPQPTIQGSGNGQYRCGVWLGGERGRARIDCRDGSRVHFYRAVVEASLGRHLRSDEHVHHINGDPTDDRLENLQVLSLSEHTRLHNRQRLVA